MDRRAFVALILVVLAAPLAAEAQPARVYRVALVSLIVPISEMAGPEPSHPIARAFIRELRALGYVEGQNLIIESRYAEGKLERLPALAAELVRLAPDVIVASAGAVTAALLQATRSASLASEASGQRGDSNTMRAPDTSPEPGSPARAVHHSTYRPRSRRPSRQLARR